MSALESIVRQQGPLQPLARSSAAMIPRRHRRACSLLVGQSPRAPIGSRSSRAASSKRRRISRVIRRVKLFAALRRATARCFSMRGHAYVYLCHGTSWMLNVSAKNAAPGAGVLLRALEPLSGIELMRRGRGGVRPADLARGPGRLAAARASIDATTASTCFVPAISGSAATAPRSARSARACASDSPRGPRRGCATTSPATVLEWPARRLNR